jgi:glyoxylase-like metal-dependent hydrolase (beta-lactamase superfamily II)
MFPDDATYIAHEEIKDILAKRNDPNRPLPTKTFKDNRMKLNVGDKTLYLDYKGANHQDGNIFVYVPDQKVLMAVDIVFPGWVPFARLAVSEHIPGYIDAHYDILKYDFETLVAGHLTRLGTRQDVETQIEYLNDVKNNAATALQTVDFMAIAQETGFENPWLLFDRYLGAVAQSCTDATVPKWVDRLGGADVFTYSHCWTMAESLRID